MEGYYRRSTPHTPRQHAYPAQAYSAQTYAPQAYPNQTHSPTQTYSTHWDYLHCRGDVYGRNVGSEYAFLLSA